MKKRILALALFAAMALSLAACSSGGNGSGSGSGSGSNSGDTKKVGLSMPTQSLERWNRDGSYLDEQFKSAGYETIITYSDNDTNRQVSDIQNMIAEGVDLLVVAAIDGEALNTVMNEAGEAGIPVIAYDRLIMNDNVSYYVSFDNYTVGTLQGQYIVDALDLNNAEGSFNIELTAGDPADNNAGYFFQGAMDVLNPFIESGKLKVVSGQTDFDTVATDTLPAGAGGSAHRGTVCLQRLRRHAHPAGVVQRTQYPSQLPGVPPGQRAEHRRPGLYPPGSQGR